jgi:integrase
MKIESYETDNGTRYKYDFTYKGQRLRAAGFLTSEDAERQALQEQLAQVGGSVGPALPAVELASAWRRANKTRWAFAKDGEKTSNQAGEFVKMFGPHAQLSHAATAPNLLKFRDYLLFERDLGNATCNRYIAAVKGMFDVAVEQGWLESAPSIRKLKETPVERKVVPSRVRVLIRQGWRCEVPGAASALFLLDTGLRLGELARAVIEGGIQESRQVVLEDTKNGDGRKVPTQWDRVPSCPEHTLRAYLAQFNLTPHDLRHTFITDLIESGTPLPVVQKLAGHRSIGTTMRYFHLTDQGASAAMERREEYVNGE